MNARNKTVSLPSNSQQQITISPQNKIQDFLQNIETKIASQIDNNGVKMPNKKIPFVLKKPQAGQLLSEKIKEMHQSRLKMQLRLNNLSKQEQQLKIQQRINRNSETRIDEKNKSCLRPRSQLTQQDLIVLKKLKRQQKQFQQSLQNKTKEHEEMLKKIKDEEQILKEKQIKEKGQARLKEIKKRLQQLQRNKAQRQKNFQEQKRKITELKAKKKLFEQLQKVQKQKNKQLMQAKVAQMTSRFKRRQIDSDMIKEHQQKYLDLKAQQRINKQQKQQEFQQQAKEHAQRLKKLQKSKFYTMTINQQKLKRKQHGEKQRQKLKRHQASMQYSESVKRDHSPTARVKTQSSDDKQKPEIGLTFQETKANGNRYMQMARQMIKKKDKNLTSQKQISVGLQTRATSTKYRDYLSQNRKARTKQQKDMNRTDQVNGIKDKKIRRDIQQIQKIVGSKEINQDKMSRIRDITQRLQMQPNDHSMLQKITAKIKILQTLANK